MDIENEAVDTNESTAADTTAQQEAAPSEAQPESYQPFASGKEKFKINGAEEEWDWETAKKYAQLGKAGQLAMQKAANVEKKQKEMYGQLVQAAEKDIFSLYEVLTGKKHPYSTQQQNGAVRQEQEVDPRDQKLREYEEKISRIEQRFEQEEIEKERHAVETELTDAVTKYPELNNPYLKHYVKSEYRKALINGLDLSLEDVAFYVAQDYRQQNAEKSKSLNEKLDYNKKRAPVIAPPSGGDKGKKPMTLEDVKRLAGRI